MKTIATHEAKTHLSRYLLAIEAGEEFIITRGKEPVAMLIPYQAERVKQRPKVGTVLDEAFHVPDEAFVPLSGSELKLWGL
jgi:antitoxin (DNA-binding transcriptional repressor) of toxin-antitoxin stability system